MATTLSELLIAAALSCLALIACDAPKITAGDDAQKMELVQHGHSSCMLVDHKVVCMPGAMYAPIRLSAYQ